MTKKLLQVFDVVGYCNTVYKRQLCGSMLHGFPCWSRLMAFQHLTLISSLMKVWWTVSLKHDASRLTRLKVHQFLSMFDALTAWSPVMHYTWSTLIFHHTWSRLTRHHRCSCMIMLHQVRSCLIFHQAWYSIMLDQGWHFINIDQAWYHVSSSTVVLDINRAELWWSTMW